MLVFGILSTALLLLSLYLMLRVLLRSHDTVRADQQSVNIALAKEQLDALRVSFDAGETGQAEFESSKKEIELNLANAVSGDNAVVSSSRSVAPNVLAVLLVVPLVVGLTGWMYLEVGDKRALDSKFIASMQPSQQVAQGHDGGSAGSSSQQAGQGNPQSADGKLPSIEELLPRLEAHLETSPDDAQGWSLLGTTYLRLRRFKDAEGALTEALGLLPDNPELMLQLADTKAMLAQGQLAGEPVALVDRALKIVPDDSKAIWLKGMASEQAGDYQDAIARWQQLLPVMQGDPQSKAQLESMIAQAQQAAGSTVQDDTAASASNSAAASTAATASTENTTAETSGAETAAASEGALSVTVKLADSLLSEVGPQTPVFIYAKALQGPPMPLAVTRQVVSDLPLSVKLDDSMAMIPTMKLSSFDQVVVGARISKTGDPIAQPGDLYGEIQGVGNSDSVEILIDQRVAP